MERESQRRQQEKRRHLLMGKVKVSRESGVLPRQCLINTHISPH